VPVLNAIRILVVDAEECTRQWVEKGLADARRSVRTASSAREAFDLALRLPFDVVVLDARLPDGDAVDLLPKFQEIVPDAEVMVVAGNGSVEGAVAAMKKGACDYIGKPFALDRLAQAVEKAYERVSVRREAQNRMHARFERSLSQRIIGRSDAMQYVLYLIEKVAPTDVPVLISGESGVGKDVAAMAIHRHGPRSGQPMIVKDCATFQKDGVMGELFGSHREALPGVKKSRAGLLPLAHKGALFLDEIAELPLEAQAALLRAIETQRYNRVGDHRERRADVRFLLVTGRDLEAEVKAGRFLSSLYHRLSAFRIHIPPLRWRKEDVPPLAEYFLGLLNGGSKPCHLSKDATQHLVGYDWPGNVRELRNIVERAAILQENGVVTVRSLPGYLTGQTRRMAGREPYRSFPSLDEVKRDHVLYALECADGNRTRAAQLLGIGRRTLYARLMEYHLEGGGPVDACPPAFDRLRKSPADTLPSLSMIN